MTKDVSPGEHVSGLIDRLEVEFARRGYTPIYVSNQIGVHDTYWFEVTGGSRIPSIIEMEYLANLAGFTLMFWRVNP